MPKTESAEARSDDPSNPPANRSIELTLEEIDDSITSLKLNAGVSTSRDAEVAGLQQESEKSRARDRDVHHLDASATATSYSRVSQLPQAEQPAGIGEQNDASPVAREDPPNSAATDRIACKLGLQNRDLVYAEESLPSRTASPGVLSTGSRRVSSLVSPLTSHITLMLTVRLRIAAPVSLSVLHANSLCPSAGTSQSLNTHA